MPCPDHVRPESLPIIIGARGPGGPGGPGGARGPGTCGRGPQETDARRYFRVEVHASATLSTQSSSTDGLSRSTVELVPVNVCDLSPEGVGLTLIEDELNVCQGDWATLNIVLDGACLHLPGRVMWTSRDAQGRRAGFNLHLELAPASSRQYYAEWIVSVMRKSAAAAQR